VVRPDDKRLKKKEKRTQDPSRHSYAAMLAHNAGRHEADSEVTSVFELEKGISADEEAHRVAAAIGLPAAFDPTIKPLNINLPHRSPSTSSNVQLSSTGTRSASPPPPTAQNDSGDDESGDDEDEYEIEAVSAQQISRESEKQTEMERVQKARLHAMEVGEAAALLKSSKENDIEEDDDDDESHDTPKT